MILLNWIDFNIPIELSHSFEWNSLIECIDLIELNNRIELNWISQRLGLLTLNKQQQYARWHRVAQQQLCVWEAIESNWIQSPLPTQKKPFNYENAGHFNAPLLPTAPSLRIIFIFPFFFFLLSSVCVVLLCDWNHRRIVSLETKQWTREIDISFSLSLDLFFLCLEKTVIYTFFFLVIIMPGSLFFCCCCQHRPLF